VTTGGAGSVWLQTAFLVKYPFDMDHHQVLGGSHGAYISVTREEDVNEMMHI
jgi:hypothetical protein